MLNLVHWMLQTKIFLKEEGEYCKMSYESLIAKESFRTFVLSNVYFISNESTLF